MTATQIRDVTCDCVCDCRAHFVAEGEVTFRALLFVPRVQPADGFNRYGTKTDHIKLYVRRVFITDEFNELMPNYLAFIQVPLPTLPH